MFALLGTSLCFAWLKKTQTKNPFFSICVSLEVELVVRLFCLIFKIDFFVFILSVNCAYFVYRRRSGSAPPRALYDCARSRTHGP